MTSRRALVVADDTEGDLQPERWAARVVAAWQREHDLTGQPPIIVAEKNAGGELVASVIEAEAGANTLPIALIPASRSKAGRAEPIVMAYRKHRVRHAAEFSELRLEMTEWEPPTPGGSRGSGWSPDRMDALVHGLRALLVDDTPLRRFGKLAAQHSKVTELPVPAWRQGRGPRSPWTPPTDDNPFL